MMMMMMMMMKSVESVRLLVILADVLGSIIKGVVCRCLLLGSIGYYITNRLHSLWNPEVQSLTHKGSPIIPTLSRIN